MSVDRPDVERIEWLARLRFDDRELDRLTAELNQILDHFQVLRSLADLGPGNTAMPGTGPASSRPSTAPEPDALEVEIQAIAPRWSDGFFVVPPPPGVHDDGGP